MVTGVPPELAALLDGSSPASRDRAWSSFLERHSGLLMRAARSFGSDYDRTMDRYEFVLEGLSRDDFSRLRSYRVNPGSTFESWLVVVARRLCLDCERARYGRGGRSALREATERQRLMRRRLVDLAGIQPDPSDRLPSGDADPERALREAELSQALEAAVGDLTPRDRLLLKLRFEDDRSMREIAEAMSFPSVFHVYRRLKTVLTDVRDCLKRMGITGPRP